MRIRSPGEQKRRAAVFAAKAFPRGLSANLFLFVAEFFDMTKGKNGCAKAEEKPEKAHRMTPVRHYASVDA